MGGLKILPTLQTFPQFLTMTCPNSPTIQTLYPAFPEATLKPGQLLTVTLPDGQSLEIDARDPSDVIVWHNNAAGDAVASLDIEQEPDTDPHPSLSAAERNPSLCR